ncbi:hypothetical protein GQR58_004161 [Nymphon striatum]|nr:hypothetical protein GQR58_004161 [Nymphon striatum]
MHSSQMFDIHMLKVRDRRLFAKVAIIWHHAKKDLAGEIKIFLKMINFVKVTKEMVTLEFHFEKKYLETITLGDWYVIVQNVTFSDNLMRMPEILAASRWYTILTGETVTGRNGHTHEVPGERASR